MPIPTKLQIHCIMWVADEPRGLMYGTNDRVLMALRKRGLVERTDSFANRSRWIVTAAGMAIIAGQTFCPHAGCIANHTFRYTEGA